MKVAVIAKLLLVQALYLTCDKFTFDFYLIANEYVRQQVW